MATENPTFFVVPDEPHKGRSGLLQAFPDAFALWSLFVFVPPLVKAVYLVDDPIVVFWMGDGLKVVPFLPILFIAIGHLLHQRRRAPSKVAVLLSLIGSSLTLGFAANRIAVRALVLGDRFEASDCDPFAEKHKLQVSWQAASDYRAGCEPSGPSGSTIQSCPGYEEELAKHPDWAVLAHLEVEFECGGWCEPRKPLWTLGARRDSCSTVAAQIFSDKVMEQAIQVVVYSVAVLVLTSVTLILLGPSLRDRGLDW